MPKKTRKMKQRAAMRRSNEAMSLPESQAENNVVEAATSPALRPVISTASRVVVPATYDYSHIYSDLKRIAIFASFFFAVLVVLSFVIK